MDNHTIFDQEGNLITGEMIIQEAMEHWSEYLESRREEFEDYMEKRCKELDEPFSKVGYHQGLQMPLYQVGMSVHGIRVTSNGLYPVQVGHVG